MKQYMFKPIEAMTFDELVQHGKDSGATIVNEMPQSFKLKDFPVTHENDQLYLITVPEGEALRATPDKMIVYNPLGALELLTVEEFNIAFVPWNQ